MNEPQTSTVKRPGRFKKLLLILVGILMLTIAGGKIWLRYKFPYGYSHSCSAGLGIGLRMYADNHEGWLPHGQTTPEESLGLLAKDDMTTAMWVLGGKNVPHKTLEAALAPGGVFSPESCGWHYIEGLREDDDPQIAVVWDKVTGLGHNGERRRGLAHEVVLLDCSHTYIFQAQWPQFIADEKERLAKVMASRETKAPPIRWSDEATLGPNRFPAPKR
jgi:hypothetical protein